MSGQNWRTPKYLFDWCVEMFGPFDIDAAADDDNHLCSEYWTPKDNALKQDWNDKLIFCNPPFNKARYFAAKARNASVKSNARICMVLPAATSSWYFHDVMDRDAADCYLIIPRVRFVDPGGNDRQSPPGGVMVMSFHPEASGKILAVRLTPDGRATVI